MILHLQFDLNVPSLPPKGHDRGDDGGGAADPGREGAGEEEVWPEGGQGQVHVEEAMSDRQ